MSENKITISNLIYALLFLLLGIFLLTGTDSIMGIISKVIGCGLIIVGIVKIVIYIYMKGKLGDYSIYNLTTGLSILAFGAILIIFSGALTLFIRIILGLWILVSGINKIIIAFSIRSNSKQAFWVYLVSALLMILCGLLLILNLFSQLLGLFIIIYAVVEIVIYIYYKVTSIKIKPRKREKKKSKRKIATKKTIEAKYEEKK